MMNQMCMLSLKTIISMGLKKKKKDLDLPGSRSALHLLGPAQGPQGAANEVQDLRKRRKNGEKWL